MYSEGKRGPVKKELCALRPKQYLNVVPLAQMHRSFRQLWPIDFKVQNKEPGSDGSEI